MCLHVDGYACFIDPTDCFCQLHTLKKNKDIAVFFFLKSKPTWRFFLPTHRHFCSDTSLTLFYLPRIIKILWKTEITVHLAMCLHQRTHFCLRSLDKTATFPDSISQSNSHNYVLIFTFKVSTWGFAEREKWHWWKKFAGVSADSVQDWAAKTVSVY